MTAANYDPESIGLPAPPAAIHFVGIGGVGVSGLARIALQMGYRVRGSDMHRSAATDELGELGIPVAIGHDAGNVGDAALVVATAAARDDNPEIEAARRASIPVVKRAALLGLLSAERLCLAVAGTHGKSTTSGMAVLALERAGLSPSYAVGATVRELGSNAALGRGPHFVVEADEYDYSFLWLRPTVAIITNIEHDHPDLFPDLLSVIDSFVRFVNCIRPGGSLVVCADDPGCQELLSRLEGGRELNVVTYGLAGDTWRLQLSTRGEAQVVGRERSIFALPLEVPGRHNLLNAVAVIAAGDALGIEPERLVAGLQEFGGVSRRFQVLIDTPRRTIIDDYAHHPTEIAATIDAARERYPGRRLVAVFQPHTYSRTLSLAPRFATSLDQADLVILAEIFASREHDTLGTSSADIGRRMQRPPVQVDAPADAVIAVSERIRDGDVVLVMGAGDITAAATALAMQCNAS